MCIQSVPDWTAKSQPGHCDRDPDRVEGWAPYGGRRDAAGAPHAAPTPPRDYVAADALGRLSLSILDEAWVNVPAFRPWTDRRQAKRRHVPKSGASAIILTPHYREVARTQLAQAAKCRTGWEAYRGYECRESGDREIRLAINTRCGTRRCEECDAVIRERQQGRCEGPWALFFTLTLPRSGTALRAWETIHEQLKAWHRELRRELKISHRQWPEKGARRWRQRRARITKAASRLRGPAKFDYAWAMEDHKDGWPHVHECLSLEWLDYRWARDLWRRCTSQKTARIDGRKVWSKNGICKYLAKYVSKGGLPPDVLAVIRGRRAWASTILKPEVLDDGFVPEALENGDEISRQVSVKESWGKVDGWIFECGKDNGYAKWWRPAREATIRILPDVRIEAEIQEVSGLYVEPILSARGYRKELETLLEEIENQKRV